MDEMEENGVVPNEVTYGVMIEAFCKEKKSGEALNLFDDMLERKYIPSSSLCCKVTDVLCQEGKVDEGCYLWKKMLKNDCLPDNALLSTLIHWLCKEGKIWEARKMFDEIEKGSVPSLLTGFVRLGMRWRELGFWRKCWIKAANKVTYNILIEGIQGRGKEGEVEKVVSMAMSSGRVNKSSWDLFLTKIVDKLDSGVDVLDQLLEESAV
ncbi:hypothetical protein CRYUN_Cryun23aG0124000 [Craigia yunnanensis]